VTAQHLKFWADDAFARKICDDLVPEQVGIYALFNARLGRVPMDNLPDTPCGEGLQTVGFEKVCRSLLLAVACVLSELSAEARWKKRGSVLLSLSHPR